MDPISFTNIYDNR